MSTETKLKRDTSQSIPSAPTGWQRFLWLGPAFLWMLSAAGSGEVLFTPRIASLYGYSLIWALIVAVCLKWFINREVGRYTVCTGKTVLEGFYSLADMGHWAVIFILVPQIVVAVATIAGMSGAAANALMLLTGGDSKILTLCVIVLTGMIVFVGKYKAIEVLASAIGVILSIAVFAGAISVVPDGREMISGLVPSLPESIDYREVLPWLGFMLAGAAGMMWYSNWIQARGYGAAEVKGDFSLQHSSGSDLSELKKWIKQMTVSNTLAVIGAMLIAVAFLILGAELLRPENLLPNEEQMSEVLGTLLGNLWGPVGFWFMISAIFITFWTTALTNQDGWSRMFATGTRLLVDHFTGTEYREEKLRKFYLVILLIVLPAVLFLIMGEPVSLLKIAGAIEAAHIPVVGGLTLYLNKRKLPSELQPSHVSLVFTAIACLFFLAFAAIYVFQL